MHLHDLEVTTKSGYKTVLVPIFRPEHVDVHMAIDEKHMNGKFYTVLSNAKTGKVALLCSTINPKELKICLDKFSPVLLSKVEFVTLPDLYPKDLVRF